MVFGCCVLLMFSCKLDSKQDEESKVTRDEEGIEEKTFEKDEYVHIIGKPLDNLNMQDIRSITDYSDNGESLKVFDKIYKSSNGYIYFTKYKSEGSDSVSIICNYLSLEWRYCPHRYKKYSFALSGKDSLISLFKYKFEYSSPYSWVCITRTMEGNLNYAPGYYVNIISELCGNQACPIGEFTHDLGFDKPGLDIKSYPEFLDYMKTYKEPGN